MQRAVQIIACRYLFFATFAHFSSRNFSISERKNRNIKIKKGSWLISSQDMSQLCILGVTVGCDGALELSNFLQFITHWRAVRGIINYYYQTHCKKINQTDDKKLPSLNSSFVSVRRGVLMTWFTVTRSGPIKVVTMYVKSRCKTVSRLPELCILLKLLAFLQL